MKAQAFLLLGLFLSASLLHAESDDAAETGIDTATVSVDGIKLFPVRGIEAYPAKRRAHEIRQRIEEIAGDKTVSVDAIKTISQKDRIQIIANDKSIMAILDADAALAGLDRSLLAEVYIQRIKEIILQYREERSPDILMKRIIHVLAATMILIMLLLANSWMFRRLHRLILQRDDSQIAALKIKSIDILTTQQVRALITGTLRVTKVLLALVMVYLYLQLALSLLPWTRAFAVALIEMTLKPVQVIGEGILDYMDNVVFLIVLVFFIRYVIKIVSMFFVALRSGRVTIAGFEPEWSWPTYRLVRMLIIAFSLVIAFPYIPGSDSAAFKGVTLFFGVLFSLGSSTYVSNIIAGYTMTYRRAFRVGDRVKIGDMVGDVKEIRLLVTHLCSLKNEEIIVPNSNILNTEVINYSTMAKDQGLILHTTVGIGYEVPWRQVEAMLLMAAQRTNGLRTEPKPYVLQKSLGDFAVNYELNAYCDEASRMMSLYSALHQNIQDVFNEYGVQIMTPSYEADTPTPKIVPKDQWYTAPAKTPGD